MRINKTFLKSSLDCATKILKFCIEKNLRCRDAPIATTRLLKSIGLSEYQERSYWKHAEDLSKEHRIILYKYGSIEFNLSFELKDVKIYHFDSIPVDYIDCKILGGDCSITNRGHALYIYVVGKIENSLIKSNGINLIRLLSITNNELAFRLIESIYSLINNNNQKGFENLANNLLSILKVPAVALILPKLPKDFNELLKFSPQLRRIAKQ
ncbi:MAG: hypothetical protein F7B61_06125 [Caldisphaeraceae archaeon]|nr:hypothetical protein [Caldisphaeraceae archaeon]